MARIVSSFIVHHFSVVARRGYASTTQDVAKGSVVAMMKKGGEESKTSSAWIPDPVTGYYKPEGHVDQIDPAELREILLKHKTRRN
ncbi:hypothetical protein L1987_59464 [Smallanthus sonchifolius]|uniref:Uncharacterized protein n=1 Tax=Smallanthus sonchifolius TaxID=185202 RepID=A0ACB9D5A9_9ASTR|nr:hypothetical protein L1987_59464 [Smallanthus sonchifolius]